MKNVLNSRRLETQSAGAYYNIEGIKSKMNERALTTYYLAEKTFQMVISSKRFC